MVRFINIVEYIFSHLCGQDVLRSFVIEGKALPFCQRCMGVYVGIGLAFIFLLVGRYHKKGLPPVSVLYVNLASLLIMPVLGFHLLDPGPGWRLWSGLIFGVAIVCLLLPGTLTIVKRGRIYGDYDRRSVMLFFVFFGLVNAMPLWFPFESVYLWYVAGALSIWGLVCASVCVVMIMIFLVKQIWTGLILKGAGNEYARG